MQVLDSKSTITAVRDQGLQNQHVFSHQYIESITSFWNISIRSSHDTIVTMSQDRSIHQLITAERKAIEKVNEAKKRRQIRLKAAKEEAAAQIAVLRQELENKLSRYEREHLGNRDDVQNAIDADIEKELREMHERVEANKDAVVARLLDLVCDIKPDLHHNLQIQKKIGENE